jgi:hypothetical protein
MGASRCEKRAPRGDGAALPVIGESLAAILPVQLLRGAVPELHRRVSREEVPHPDSSNARLEMAFLGARPRRLSPGVPVPEGPWSSSSAPSQRDNVRRRFRAAPLVEPPGQRSGHVRKAHGDRLDDCGLKVRVRRFRPVVRSLRSDSVRFGRLPGRLRSDAQSVQGLFYRCFSHFFRPRSILVSSTGSLS